MSHITTRQVLLNDSSISRQRVLLASQRVPADPASKEGRFMATYTVKKNLTGCSRPLSGLRFELVASLMAIALPLSAGSLSDRAQVSDLPPLADISAGDRHDEHTRISKIEYEQAGCAWGCRNFTVVIGNEYINGSEYKIEFRGIPDHASIQQFRGTRQESTFGTYFGKADYRALYNLLEFLTREKVHEINGAYTSNATDQNSTYFSITRDGKSTLVEQNGRTHQYEVEMTEYLIVKLIETAEYRVPSEYEVTDSGIITNRGIPVNTENISRNEALSAVDSLFTTSVDNIVGGMSKEQKLEYGDAIEQNWNNIRRNRLRLVERVDDFIVLTFEHGEVGHMTLKLHPSCNSLRCNFTAIKLSVRQV